MLLSDSAKLLRWAESVINVINLYNISECDYYMGTWECECVVSEMCDE